MAGRVLSIEVEQSVTRVVEMDYGVKSPRIYNAFSFETPPGTLNEEGMTVNDSIVGLMRQGLTQNGIHTNKAIFALASSRIASKEVMIPTVKDNKIKQVLLANSKEYFPVDLSQYELVYRIMERMKEEKQLKLMVFAVPRALLMSCQQLAKAWGFQLVGVDYSGNSIHQAMMRTMNPALAVTVCVEDRYSMLTIVKDGKVDFQRPISYGIDDAVEIVRTGGRAGGGTEYGSPEEPERLSGMSYLEAFERLRSGSYVNKRLGEEESSKAVDDWDDDVEDPGTSGIRAKVTAEFELLIGSLSRVFDYYVSRNSDTEIEEIRLTGLGAGCQGLDRLLSNELGVAVTVLKDSRIGLSRNLLRNKFKLAEYFIAVGATYEPLNFELASGGQKTSSKANDSFALPLLVLVGGLALSGVILGLEFMNVMNLTQDNQAMVDDIKRKLPAVEVYNKFLIQRKTADGLRAADRNSDVPNDLFLRFLADLEAHMPSDMIIDTLSVSEDTMTISSLCMSKESAAEALMQMRSFDTLLRVVSTELTEEDTEAIPMWRLEVSLTYQDLRVVEAMDQAAAESDADTEDTESTENAEGGEGSEAAE
ncbi:MAG: hypothetical protein J1D89_01310 [Agathobacter sp.]|nr:hypothetical protein [Agathobacter sp.]